MNLTSNILLNKLGRLKRRVNKWKLSLEDLSDNQFLVFLAGMRFLQNQNLELSWRISSDEIYKREELTLELSSKFNSWKNRIS